MSLFKIIDDKFNERDTLRRSEEVLSISIEDWRMFDEMTAIIDSITRETKISIKVNPFFIPITVRAAHLKSFAGPVIANPQTAPMARLQEFASLVRDEPP